MQKTTTQDGTIRSEVYEVGMTKNNERKVEKRRRQRRF